MWPPTQKFSENDPEYKDWKKERAVQVQNMANSNGPFQSPIDLNINNMTVLELPILHWHNYTQPPMKMKITNSGHTVIVSAKWGQERPFICDGPLLDSGYVFSQMHFHWGETDNEGSEHTVDGSSFPMEMHVVHFKSCYLTQESALREKDGMITMVYFFKLQSSPNPDMKGLIDSLQYVQKPHTSARIDPLPLSFLVKTFNHDYFLYWGSVMTSTCAHLILWFISREPIGINSEQLAKFRMISDIGEQPMMRNFRETQPSKSNSVFHISPSTSRATTLMPITQSHHPITSHPEPNYDQVDQVPDQNSQKQKTSREMKGTVDEPSGIQNASYNLPQSQMASVYREMSQNMPTFNTIPLTMGYNQPLFYTADPTHGYLQHPDSFSVPVGPLYNTHQNLYNYTGRPIMVPYSPAYPYTEIPRKNVEGTDIPRHTNIISQNEGLNYNNTVPTLINKPHTKKEINKATPKFSHESQTNSSPKPAEMYIMKNMGSPNIFPKDSITFNKRNTHHKLSELDSELKMKTLHNNGKHVQDGRLRVILPEGTMLGSTEVPTPNKGPWFLHTSPQPIVMPQTCKEAKYYSTTDTNYSQEPFT